MVGLGMYFIVFMAVFFWLSAKRKIDAYPWLLKVAVWSIPLPWIAAEAGWIVAELGRQPWAVEGVLPTAVAVSNLGIQTVLTTLIGFVVLYTVLIVVEMKLMLKAIRKGPEREHGAAPGIASPLIGATPALRTAPMISTE
jgi:cytochrome d ubiquinol oxidase subunit I